LDFDPAESDIPRYWFGGSAVATHLANGLNLLFPDGERFFVRSVRYYAQALEDDPMLKHEVRGFYAQEGSHAREHQRFFEVLEAQGYPIQDFLSEFRKSLESMSALFPPSVQLAGTAAAEHFTAIMANHALELRVLDEAHPTMRHLLLWHATEEIEHKAVAFDVFQKVSGSYLVRVLGIAFASLFLAYWWQRATRMLLRHDGVTREDVRREKARIAELHEQRGNVVTDVFLRGIAEYVRPGFHPWQKDDLHLAEAYLAEAGLG
jgi:predicted metal-dependent hydrolase